MSAAPKIARVRHELKRRRLTVKRVTRIASKMVRVVFYGEDLRDFKSLSFDDHVKLFFPPAGADGAPQMRDFTPRSFDIEACELTIDFFLHQAGPAVSWAAQAEVGQTLEIAGPRGSTVICPEGIDSYVLIGDETALPAIGRRLEDLPYNTPVLVVIEHDGASEWPSFVSQADLRVIWVARDGHIDPPAHELIAALRALKFPPGNCFVWVAIESHAARAIRKYLCEERGIEKRWVKAVGYWQRGSTGTHDPVGDTE